MVVTEMFHLAVPERRRAVEGHDPMNAMQHSGVRAVLTDSAIELVLTFTLLLCVATIARVVEGPSPVSDALQNAQAKLLVVAAGVALLIAALILSPLGRASGGHMNPAISLAMWRFGVFPGTAVLPYAVAQLFGSLLGVLAARAAWGPILADPPVSYAVLLPGPGWTTTTLFFGEAASTGVIVVLVGIALATPRLLSAVPWIVGGLVFCGIVLLGTSTGASMNPAREFGPAAASGQIEFLWVYLSAPMIGALLAATALAAVQRRAVLTHRLCGTVSA
jgi:glycerol uptake facilitator-like aquaporin